MDNLHYNGSLIDDIKIVKKVNKRNTKLWNKLDTAYILTLVILCIIILAQLINGEPYIPLVNFTSSTLIIVRNSISTKFSKDKIKFYNAKTKIGNLIKDIYHKKEETFNNQSAKINIDDFVNSLVIESTSKTKKYDDYNDLYEDIEKLYNYIYFLDENDQINLLKEIRTKIKKPHNQEIEKTELELVEIEDPSELPVKQTLKLIKK